MADKLLIRLYNVELGDCIYCRFPGALATPGGVDDFHMLIDCGSWGSSASLRSAVEHLKADLPLGADGKRRIDLLVVTHEHKDHIAGFDQDIFGGLRIGNIWMSTAMNREHKQSQRTFALQDLTRRAMQSVAAMKLELGAELQELVDLYAVTNDDAIQTLQKILPERNGITPRYVHAGESAESLGLALQGVTIDVLGPEEDIDGYYLSIGLQI